MNIQQFPIESLRPYSRNAKTHPKDQIDRIARQIHEVGFLVPIVVDKDMVVIAGHGRLLAAKQLAMTEVPVVVADHLTEDQALAWRIADNKVADSPFDMQLLGFELKTLEMHQVDLTLSGFSLKEAKASIELLAGNDPSPREPGEGAQELGEEGFQEFDHKCPKCGFEFDEAKGS